MAPARARSLYRGAARSGAVLVVRLCSLAAAAAQQGQRREFPLLAVDVLPAGGEPWSGKEWLAGRARLAEPGAFGNATAAEAGGGGAEAGMPACIPRLLWPPASPASPTNGIANSPYAPTGLRSMALTVPAPAPRFAVHHIIALGMIIRNAVTIEGVMRSTSDGSGSAIAAAVAGGRGRGRGGGSPLPDVDRDVCSKAAPDVPQVVIVQIYDFITKRMVLSRRVRRPRRRPARAPRKFRAPSTPRRTSASPDSRAEASI